MFKILVLFALGALISGQAFRDIPLFQFGYVKPGEMQSSPVLTISGTLDLASNDTLDMASNDTLDLASNDTLDLASNSTLQPYKATEDIMKRFLMSLQIKSIVMEYNNLIEDLPSPKVEGPKPSLHYETPSLPYPRSSFATRYESRHMAPESLSPVVNLITGFFQTRTNSRHTAVPKSESPLVKFIRGFFQPQLQSDVMTIIKTSLSKLNRTNLTQAFNSSFPSDHLIII